MDHSWCIVCETFIPPRTAKVDGGKGKDEGGRTRRLSALEAVAGKRSEVQAAQPSKTQSSSNPSQNLGNTKSPWQDLPTPLDKKAPKTKGKGQGPPSNLHRKVNSKSTSSLVALEQAAAAAATAGKRPEIAPLNGPAQKILNGPVPPQQGKTGQVPRHANIVPSMAHLTPAQIRALAHQARLEQQKDAAAQAAAQEAQAVREQEKKQASLLEEEAWTERERALYCSEACRLADREAKDGFSDSTNIVTSEGSSSSVAERGILSAFEERGRRRSSGVQSEPWTSDDRRVLMTSDAAILTSSSAGGGGLQSSASLVSLASLAHSVSRDLNSPTSTASQAASNANEDSPTAFHEGEREPTTAIRRNASSGSLVQPTSVGLPIQAVPAAVQSVLPPLTKKRESLTLLPESLFPHTFHHSPGANGLGHFSGKESILHGYAEVMGGRPTAPRMRRNGSNTSLLSVDSEESGMSHSSIGSSRYSDGMAAMENSRVALLPPYQPEGVTFQLGERRYSNSSTSSNGSNATWNHGSGGSAHPHAHAIASHRLNSHLGTSPGRGKALAGTRLRPLTPVRAQTSEPPLSGSSGLQLLPSHPSRRRAERSFSDSESGTSMPATRSASADAALRASSYERSRSLHLLGQSSPPTSHSHDERERENGHGTELDQSGTEEEEEKGLDGPEPLTPPPPPPPVQLQRLGSWGWGLGRILPTLGLTAPLQEVVSTAQTAVNTVVQVTGWPASTYRQAVALSTPSTGLIDPVHGGSTPSQAQASLYAAAGLAKSGTVPAPTSPSKMNNSSESRRQPPPPPPSSSSSLGLVSMALGLGGRSHVQ